MAEENSAWRRIWKKCHVCEADFSVAYFDAPDFPEETAKEKAAAEAQTMCGSECVRASKVILAGTAFISD